MQVGVNITFPTSMNIACCGLVGCISKYVMHNCVDDLTILRYFNIGGHTTKVPKIIAMFWKGLLWVTLNATLMM